MVTLVRCFLKKIQNVSLSQQVTNHSLLLKVLLVSQRRLTRLDRNLLELFLTVLVRMLLRLSQELTDSHSLRQRWIMLQAKLRKSKESHILTDFVLRLTATVLQLCGRRMLISLSQVTQLTLQDSSIQLQVHTRRKDLKLARSTSQQLQVVVQVVHFTQIIWQQVLLLMV